MHLINPLVAGIRGAEIGSVELLERGTSTHAAYYRDFPATQQYSAQPIPLDSFGSATLYVDELVDVLVHDSNGVLVRQFVAGDYAAAVEVISQSFTGVDYRDGSRGAHKPTNLASVLDLWKTNSGAIDWKVLVGGNVLTIGDALATFSGLYFNVKSYGALGNGVADDGAAITAAMAAAAVSGGTVFFPPGTFRTTTVISIPPKVSLLGSGAAATKLAIDNAASSCIVFGLGPADSGARTVRDLWIGSINTVNTQSLVGTSNPTLRALFEDCVFGNDTTTKGVHVTLQTSDLNSLVQFNRCAFYEMNNSSIIITGSSGVGRSIFRDCEFKSLYTALAVSNPHIVAIDGMLVDGCRFDASAVTGPGFSYILMLPLGQFGGNKFINNRFTVGPATISAFRTTTPTPTFGIWESGNSFGDATTGYLPMYADTADGYAAVIQDSVGLRTHGSRANRVVGMNSDTPTQSLDGKNYGIGIIRRNVLGAQTITTNLGSLGDPFLVQVINNTGSPLTPSFGSGFSVTSGGILLIPIGGKGQYQFMYLPSTTGTTGAFQLTGQAVSL